MTRVSKIILPPDEERRSALEAKLREYKEKLDKRKEENPYMHPDLFAKINSRALYKYDILERMMENGEIDTHDFSLELNDK